MKKVISIAILFLVSLLMESCSFISINWEHTIKIDTLNHISTVVINSNLKIFTTTVTAFGTPGPLEGIGSGVIIKKDNQNNFYLLTNRHVIDLSDQYKEVYTIEDIYNKRKQATLVASNSDYDLAILRFNSDEQMEVMAFASKNPEIGDLVFSIGSPAGKQNIITAGTVQAYQKIENVSYEVIIHNAVIRGGSSGSMLINDLYQIVGLNTWGFGDENSSQEYFMGGATPVEKIMEFFEESQFSLNE